MLQDIFPHVYHNEYTENRSARDGDRLLCFRRGSLLCRADGCVTLPLCSGGQYLFSVDDVGYFLHEGDPLPEADGFFYHSCRELRDCTPDETLFACAVGESLHRWYENNRFCGRCGGGMGKSTAERALVCQNCGSTVYPKICPAVIAAVTDGDRLLLTKYAGRAFQRYALVAGFNEIGESIEDTVRREVMEEVGLRVKNLRFYRSQPWAYTDSLLLGFFCELDGSDVITRQESELAEAAWYLRKDLPREHSGISLTGEMIECFRRGGDKTVPPLQGAAGLPL